jgi:hypothetical protein
MAYRNLRIIAVK